jgi:excisionase family DNA binding protein
MTNPAAVSEVLNVDAAAALLGVHPNTVRSLVASRAIPFAKVGRQYRFSRSRLLTWIEAGGCDTNGLGETTEPLALLGRR